MTLNQVLEIQAVLADRSIPKDIEELTRFVRYSKTSGKDQCIGDLNIINVLRVLRKEVI